MIRLKQCIRNTHHGYSDHSADCPWYRMLQENKSDPFPGHLVDYQAAPQKDGIDIPQSPENPKLNEPLQIPAVTTASSRKFVYIGALIAVTGNGI